jgi:hypothetical protein
VDCGHAAETAETARGARSRRTNAIAKQAAGADRFQALPRNSPLPGLVSCELLGLEGSTDPLGVVPRRRCARPAPNKNNHK